jgi:(R,R)-butanediol dehydrogenase/meso-butanediol dehydrogenase/diacetyl reductase
VITGTMPAAVYHGVRDIRFEEREVPRAGPGELLLRVGTVGVCGTDSAEWGHGPVLFPLRARHHATGHLGPVVPGHEFSGTVIAVGTGVDEAWIGQQVASCGSVACGTCAACNRGASNLCVRYAGVGLHRDGALAGYVTTPAESCQSIEGLGISLDEAALCQPMAIAVHCMRRAGEVADRLVLVQGIGGIGAFLVFALAQAGATVIAADMDAERLDIARELGAETSIVVNGDATDQDLIREAVGDGDLRIVFEVSGSAGGLRTALAVSPKGATIVEVGIQKGLSELDLRSLTLMEQSLVGTNAQVREADFPDAVALIARRPGGWSRLAPTVLPMRSVVEGALAPMAAGRAPAIKSLVDPWADDSRPMVGLAD